MDLFVLGAGASAPYGFPVGAELKKLLIRASLTDFAGHPVFQRVQPADYDDFSRIFEFSRTPSIDLFLTRNPQFALLGKLAIGHFILEAERRSFARHQVVEDDWYAVLYQRLTSGLYRKEETARVLESFEVISFNYDRSLEHFLSTSLYYSFFHPRQSFETADLSLVPRLQLEHMYGTLGPITEVPYGNAAAWDHQMDERLLLNLKTSYDQRQGVRRLQERFDRAERIYFLGFGFGAENLRNLGLAEVDLAGKDVFGTVVGFEAAEVERIAAPFAGARRVVLESVNCSLLLRRRY